jgi:hypothetical protein
MKVGNNLHTFSFESLNYLRELWLNKEAWLAINMNDINASALNLSLKLSIISGWRTGADTLPAASNEWLIISNNRAASLREDSDVVL